MSSTAGLATAAAAQASSLPTPCHLSQPQLRSTGRVKDCCLQQSLEKIPLPVHYQGSWRGALRSKHCTGTLSFECFLGSQLSLPKMHPVKPTAPVCRQAGAVCAAWGRGHSRRGMLGHQGRGQGLLGEAGGVLEPDGCEEAGHRAVGWEVNSEITGLALETSLPQDRSCSA